MFHGAAQAVVDGDGSALATFLETDPSLITARGKRGETLLHYVAANGVDDAMQRTPANAPAVARMLLDAGAEPDALMSSYGGGSNQTPLCLLVSSSHPFERGVQCELIEVLIEGGAQIDGLDGDGAPLATALVFGYTRAAETLRDLGARTDNVLFRAGLGDRAGVESMFDQSGAMPLRAVGSYRPPFPRAGNWTGDALLQEALHLAATHGRLDVCRLLIDRGADPNGICTGHHAALPLLQALFVRELGAAELLLEAGADPIRPDPKLGRTALQAAAAAGAEALALVSKHVDGP